MAVYENYSLTIFSEIFSWPFPTLILSGEERPIKLENFEVKLALSLLVTLIVEVLRISDY